MSSGGSSEIFWPFVESDALATLNRYLTLYNSELVRLSREQHIDSPIAMDCSFPSVPADHQFVVKHLLAALRDSTDLAAAENAVAPCAPPTILAIFASLICSHLNPNLGWNAFSGTIGDIESRLSRMLAGLVGFDPLTAAGVSTYGGAGCVLYGVRCGIERALRAVPSDRHKLRIFRSVIGHSSTLKAAEWLGLSADAIVNVESQNRCINLDNLIVMLKKNIKKNFLIGCIVLEAGSTYDFSIDDFAAVRSACDELMEKYNIPYRPFIYVDGAIGGLHSVFRDYDVKSNALKFDQETLNSVRWIGSRLQPLCLADAIGVDFHKLGFVPLASSMFVVADQNDLYLLSGTSKGPAGNKNSPDVNFADPVDWTLEASRGAGGMLGAYANCAMLGKDGYRKYFGYLISLANNMRMLLASVKGCNLYNAAHPGPAIVMRWYPRDMIGNPKSSEGEASIAIDKFNSEIFERFECTNHGDIGLRLGLTRTYDVSTTSRQQSLVCIKGYFVNPRTTQDNVLQAVCNLQECYDKLC